MHRFALLAAVSNFLALVLSISAVRWADPSPLYLKRYAETLERFKEEAKGETDPQEVAMKGALAIVQNINYAKGAGASFSLLQLACWIVSACASLNLVLLWLGRSRSPRKPIA